MSVAVVSRFLALLAVLAFTGGSVILVALAMRASLLRALEPIALRLAWTVSAVAVTGSLYYSEVANYTPCRLCWFQRIGIYPLVVLLLVAIVRRRRDVADFVLPLTLLTAPVSAYHWLLQRYPSIGGESCDASAPCSVQWVSELGFVSIPFMALATVVAVTGLVLVPQRYPDG